MSQLPRQPVMIDPTTGMPYPMDPGIDPTMGMPSPPPAQQPGFMSKITQALGGPQGMMNLGASLMAGSGPSPVRQNFGSILGQSLLQNQQFQQQSSDSELKKALLMSQIQKANQKPQQKRYVVNGALVDEEGKPIYESPAKAGGGVGAYQPGDYTPASWAKFLKSNDPAELERYQTPRQEFSPSFQNVTRTNPDGSTQQGTFNTRDGAYNWNGQVVPAGTAARTNAAGRAEGAITGAREGKAPIAYSTFQTGIKSLEKAMSGTVTGPIMGRIPAMTAGQQIAEGAEATMAPVLKQLFRDAGEGTFTDSDQALLMKMVPKRTDHTEARKAKIEMIDGIVREKLGLGEGAALPARAGGSNIESLLDKYAPK
jgi:hypothetical protein